MNFTLRNNKLVVGDLFAEGMKYGDGIFETILVKKEKGMLLQLHFSRMTFGAKVLGYNLQWLNFGFFAEMVDAAIEKSEIINGSLRVTVWRDENVFFGKQTQPAKVSIEAREGVGKVHPIALAVCNVPSIISSSTANLKTCNFLPYIQAKQFAQNQNCGDALLLNNFGRVVEASSSNVFIIKGNEIYTPALSEGCVSGIIRKLLLQHLPNLGFRIMEKEISQAELSGADEIFLTNCVKLITPVQKFQQKNLSMDLTIDLKKKLAKAHPEMGF